MNLLLQLKYAFYTTLVFFLMACPETYKVIQNIAGPYLGHYVGTLSHNGLPTMLGLAVQTGLFFIVMTALLSIPRT
jgi:hypothetical protein